MKITVVTMKGVRTYSCFYEMMRDYSIDGHLEDCSKERMAGGCVHRAELDNQPIFKGLAGPMWDNGGLRYETWDVYALLSM